ncbi:hypothetical protein NEMIN01_1153 [Nematocida minor]|uniref:uncharacterized protein n=1 Tax=Nematocida minor TaxID=1912983 RepID=UPI00221EC391|nr:uncharacterized protein NEMIN01_1153 [Nematocida minor]KAI5190688.1 hypothetical protein NEMIN01_1153 [Nematocida minor]
MILHRGLLKQIIFAGAIALSYLQGASCAAEDKNAFLDNLDLYWSNRIEFIEKEIQIRKVLLVKAEFLKSKENCLFDANYDLETGKDGMVQITGDLSALSAIWNEMKRLTKGLRELNTHISRRQLTSGDAMETSSYAMLEITTDDIMKIMLDDKMEAIPHDMMEAISELNSMQNTNLKSIMRKVLINSTLLIEKIQGFNLLMLRFIANYSSMKNGYNARIHELPLFKLAKRNKVFAVDTVFTFFGIEALKSTSDKEVSAQQLGYIKDCLGSSISGGDGIIASYVNAVMEDIRKSKTNSLVSANMHFPVIFRDYSLNIDEDENIINIYLRFAENDLSQIEMHKYRNITPEQVTKMIMVEYLMDERLLNIRKNFLFSNLEKTIRSMGGISRKKMLTILNLLWDDQYCRRTGSIPLEVFCKENAISAIFFETMRASFMASKWIYIADKKKLHSENMFLQDKSSTHFDLSYLHPSQYI